MKKKCDALRDAIAVKTNNMQAVVMIMQERVSSRELTCWPLYPPRVRGCAPNVRQVMAMTMQQQQQQQQQQQPLPE